MTSPLERYKILGEIGSGAYGTVYRAEHTISHKVFALKQIRQQTEWKHAVKMNELKSFQSLKQSSQYIVQLYELFRAEDSVYLVFELVTGGSLCELVQRRPLDLAGAIHLLSDISRGMSALHASGFMHRDLKPENILYQRSENTFKISDLGCARNFRTIGNLTAYVGTRWYRAPEMLLHCRRYDAKVDIFSAGLLVCEALVGKPLIAGTSELSQAQEIFKFLGLSQAEYDWFRQNGSCQIVCDITGSVDSLGRIERAVMQGVRGCSLELAHILARMLQPLPERRCSAAELVTALDRIKKTGIAQTSQSQRPVETQIELHEKAYKSEQIHNVKEVSAFEDNVGLDDW